MRCEACSTYSPAPACLLILTRSRLNYTISSTEITISSQLSIDLGMSGELALKDTLRQDPALSPESGQLVCNFPIDCRFVSQRVMEVMMNYVPQLCSHISRQF